MEKTFQKQIRQIDALLHRFGALWTRVSAEIPALRVLAPFVVSLFLAMSLARCTPVAPSFLKSLPRSNFGSANLNPAAEGASTGPSAQPTPAQTQAQFSVEIWNWDLDAKEWKTFPGIALEDAQIDELVSKGFIQFEVAEPESPKEWRIAMSTQDAEGKRPQMKVNRVSGSKQNWELRISNFEDKLLWNIDRIRVAWERPGRLAWIATR